MTPLSRLIRKSQERYDEEFRQLFWDSIEEERIYTRIKSFLERELERLEDNINEIKKLREEYKKSLLIPKKEK